MTTKIFTSYAAVLVTVIALALMGITFAYASEVTGVLSSDASSAPLNSGTLNGDVTSDGSTLSGTVTSDSDSSSSSGGGGSSRSSSNSPSGAVLGASTSNVSAPSFPNAGFAPDEAR